jgi:chromosome partitioning protein
MTQHYTIQRLIQLFGSSATRSVLLAAEKSQSIPTPERIQTGSLARRVWSMNSLPLIGERFGFLGPQKSALCISVYSAKGGVFKTSLALNLGRMAALHNIRTCVIGLDFQSDITRLLGPSTEEETDIETAMIRVRSVRGLLDMFAGENLDNILCPTDIPTLDYIPETAGLITLERTIGAQDRREYKLKEQIITKLRSRYGLIILDCPPSWSHLITNAIVACDLLISPLECKISQFNSLSVFLDHIEAFRSTMKLNYRHVYVPTRFTPNRRLSVDIRNWYVENLKRVSMGVVRESAVGEEAIAAKVSLPEHCPNSPYADEMRELIRELWAVAEPAMNNDRMVG